MRLSLTSCHTNKEIGTEKEKSVIHNLLDGFPARLKIFSRFLHKFHLIIYSGSLSELVTAGYQRKPTQKLAYFQ